MKTRLQESSLSGFGRKLTYTELGDLEKKLYSFLKEHEIYPEDGTFNNSSSPLVDLELYLIIDGDWKHDHLYTEQLVEEFCDANDLVILKHINNEIGNSDSDFYRSEHKWFICIKTENIDKETVSGLHKIFSEELNETLVQELGKDYENIVLEDDESAVGGVAFFGETLGDFLAEVESPVESLEELNKLLKENGIKILEKEVDSLTEVPSKTISSYNHTAEEVMAARVARYIFDLYPKNGDPQETGYFDSALDIVYSYINNKPINANNTEEVEEIETEEQLKNILRKYTITTLVRMVDKIEKVTHQPFDEYDCWMPFEN